MHFLKKDEIRGAAALGKERACITVRFSNDELTVQENSLGILKPDALVVRLPGRIKVVDVDGEIIKPNGVFMVTTETFNPCHVLTDVF